MQDEFMRQTSLAIMVCTEGLQDKAKHFGLTPRCFSDRFKEIAHFQFLSTLACAQPMPYIQCRQEVVLYKLAYTVQHFWCFEATLGSKLLCWAKQQH